MRAPFLVRSVALVASACLPVLDDPTPYVDAPRVLAVRVAPAEVAAGEDVRLVALYADARGALAEVPVDWSFCTQPKPLAELGPVAVGCLDPASPALLPIGRGGDVVARVPEDACSRFGPNPPPPEEGQPSGRPTDPDITGGYHQPIVGFPDDTGQDLTLVSVRVRCGLANVGQEAYVAWNTAYRDNVAPRPTALWLGRGGVEVPATADGAGDPVDVAPGEVVTLRVGWTACPTAGVCGDGVCSPDEAVADCPDDCSAPVGCAGAETYVVHDVATGALVVRREAISATWFTTAGTLALARSGRPGDDDEPSASDTWTAPETPGDVWLAVVLRDERGGVDFGTWRIRVAP